MGKKSLKQCSALIMKEMELLAYDKSISNKDYGEEIQSIVLEIGHANFQEKGLRIFEHNFSRATTIQARKVFRQLKDSKHIKSQDDALQYLQQKFKNSMTKHVFGCFQNWIKRCSFNGANSADLGAKTNIDYDTESTDSESLATSVYDDDEEQEEDEGQEQPPKKRAVIDDGEKREGQTKRLKDNGHDKNTPIILVED